MTGGMLDLGELVKRAIKYLVEGLMVAIAAYAIPKKALNLDEVALIALTAAATFSILDTYVPFPSCWSSLRSRIRYWSQSCKIPRWILN